MKKIKPNQPVDIKFKAYINKVASYIRTEIFSGEYEMIIEFKTENESRENQNDNRFEKHATCLIDFRYLIFTLAIYPILFEQYKQKDGRAICNIICHEICHILTEPLYFFAIPTITNATQDTLEEVRERQTQRITNVIMNYIPKSVYTIK